MPLSRVFLSSLFLLALKITHTLASSPSPDIEDAAISTETETIRLIGGFTGESEGTKSLESRNSDDNGILAQVSMEYQTIPPISAQLKSSGLQSNVSVGLYCSECADTTQPAAFDFASQNYTGWNDSWLGIVLETFDASFEIEVSLSDSANDNLALSLLKLTAQTGAVVVDVEFQLFLAADASSTTSLTTGIDLTLGSPAAIMMPAWGSAVNLTQSQGIGFTQESFDLIPNFNASMPNLNASVQFSLQTIFSVTVNDINIGSLYLDLPAFNFDVDTVSNARSNCQPATATTNADDVYAELIHLDGSLNAVLGYKLFDGQETGLVGAWAMRSALDECYAFFPGLGFIGDVPASPKSTLLNSPPITQSTTGNGTAGTGTGAVVVALKSLSPGAKAGAVIGTLIGVAIVAVLAWFAGHESARRSLKDAKTESVQSVPFIRPRLPRLRRNRSSTTTFTSMGPGTPAWRSVDNRSGSYLDSNTPRGPWTTEVEPVPPIPPPHNYNYFPINQHSALASPRMEGMEPFVFPRSPAATTGHESMGTPQSHWQDERRLKTISSILRKPVAKRPPGTRVL